MSRIAGEQVGPARMQALCQSCLAPIEWVKTVNGKSIPLDVGEAPNGNIEVTNGIAHVILHRPVENPRRSHFVTCPNADEHRSKP